MSPDWWKPPRGVRCWRVIGGASGVVSSSSLRDPARCARRRGLGVDARGVETSPRARARAAAVVVVWAAGGRGRVVQGFIDACPEARRDDLCFMHNGESSVPPKTRLRADADARVWQLPRRVRERQICTPWFVCVRNDARSPRTSRVRPLNTPGAFIEKLLRRSGLFYERQTQATLYFVINEFGVAIDGLTTIGIDAKVRHCPLQQKLYEKTGERTRRVSGSRVPSLCATRTTGVR